MFSGKALQILFKQESSIKISNVEILTVCHDFFANFQLVCSSPISYDTDYENLEIEDIEQYDESLYKEGVHQFIGENEVYYVDLDGNKYFHTIHTIINCFIVMSTNIERSV